MKESKAVYVTRHRIRNDLKFVYDVETNWDRQYRRTERFEDNRKSNEFACQFDSKRDGCNCRNVYMRDAMYFSQIPNQIYEYHGSRSFTDVGVGSVKTLPRRKVKRIYLPETDERGVGSSDLSSCVIRKTRQSKGSCYNQKKTLSKCVGNEYDTGCVISEKLSPILNTKSGTTSPRETQEQKNIEIGSNTVVKKVETIGTQFEIVDKEEEKVTPKMEEPTLEVISPEASESTLKYNNSCSIKKSNSKTKEFDRQFSSDSLVEHIHDLEVPSADKPSRETSYYPVENKAESEYRHMFEVNYSNPYCEKQVPSVDNRSRVTALDPMENKVESNYSHMFAVNDSKASCEKSDIKSASILRRRFDALRRGLTKKDDLKKSSLFQKSSHSRVSTPSHKDASVTSDPPSLEGRSFSDTKRYSPIQANIIKQDGSKMNYRSEKETLQYSATESDCQRVKGKFKLWGKKCNQEEDSFKPPTLMPACDISNKLEKEVEKKESEEKKPEPEAKKEKRFFFFKKKSKEKPKQPCKKKPKHITAGRCEIKDGLTLKMGKQSTQTPVQKEKYSEASREREEITRKRCLQRCLSSGIESARSVNVRWNNTTYTTSSSTIFELLDTVYKNTEMFIRSLSDVNMDAYYNTNAKNKVNFIQDIEAWMIPRTIPDRRKEIPIKICQNIEPKRIELSYFNQNWLIDESQALSHKIEVILHSKNRNNSSEYLKIDIPRDFFDDVSSEDSKCNLTSDEEVYKIVEYETDSDFNNRRHGRMEKGDNSQSDIRVIVSVQDSNNLESKILETVIKGPPMHRDVIIQGSNVNVPKRCDVIGVGIITQRDLREIRKPILKIQTISSSDDSDPPPILKQNKCEFAKSYLQEYYKTWTPLSLDFYSCVSDSNLKSCSQEQSLSPYNQQGDSPKSCPNMYDDYHASAIISSCETSSSFNTTTCGKIPSRFLSFIKKTTNSSKIINKRSNVGKGIRMLPKDSLEVIKKRKFYALSNKGQWHQSADKPVSVPSISMLLLSRGEEQDYFKCPTENETRSNDTEPGAVRGIEINIDNCNKDDCPTLDTLIKKKKGAKKHVFLPDSKTVQSNTTVQLNTVEKQQGNVGGILTFQRSSICEYCKKKMVTSLKHASISLLPSIEIPPQPYKVICESEEQEKPPSDRPSPLSCNISRADIILNSVTPRPPKVPPSPPKVPPSPPKVPPTPPEVPLLKPHPPSPPKCDPPSPPKSDVSSLPYVKSPSKNDPSCPPKSNPPNPPKSSPPSPPKTDLSCLTLKVLNTLQSDPPSPSKSDLSCLPLRVPIPPKCNSSCPPKSDSTSPPPCPIKTHSSPPSSSPTLPTPEPKEQPLPKYTYATDTSPRSETTNNAPCPNTNPDASGVPSLCPASLAIDQKPSQLQSLAYTFGTQSSTKSGEVYPPCAAMVPDHRGIRPPCPSTLPKCPYNLPKNLPWACPGCVPVCQRPTSSLLTPDPKCQCDNKAMSTEKKERFSLLPQRSGLKISIIKASKSEKLKRPVDAMKPDHLDDTSPYRLTIPISPEHTPNNQSSPPRPDSLPPYERISSNHIPNNSSSPPHTDSLPLYERLSPKRIPNNSPSSPHPESLPPYERLSPKRIPNNSSSSPHPDSLPPFERLSPKRIPNNSSSSPHPDSLPPYERISSKHIPNNSSSPPHTDSLPPTERISSKHIPNNSSSPPHTDSLPPTERISSKHIPNNSSSPPHTDSLPPTERISSKHIPNNSSSPPHTDSLPPTERISSKHIPNNSSSPPHTDSLPPYERLSPKRIPNNSPSSPRPDSLPPYERISSKHIPNNSSSPPHTDSLPPTERISSKYIPNNSSSPPHTDSLPPTERISSKHIPNNSSSPPHTDSLPPYERISSKHIPNNSSSPPHTDSLPPYERLSPKRIPNNSPSSPRPDSLPPYERISSKHIPNNSSSPPHTGSLPPYERISSKHIPNNSSSPPHTDSLPPTERISSKHIPNNSSSPPHTDSLPPYERLSPKRIPNDSPSSPRPDSLPPYERISSKHIPNNSSSPPHTDSLPPYERISSKHIPNNSSSPPHTDSLPPTERISSKHIPNNSSSPPHTDSLPPYERLSPKRIPNNSPSSPHPDSLTPYERLSPKRIPNNSPSSPHPDSLPPFERLSPKHLPNFPSSPPRPDSLPPCERLSPKHIPNNPSSPPIIDCLPPCDRLSPKHIPNNPSSPPIIDCLPPCERLSPKHLPNFPSSPLRPDSLPPCKRLSPKHIPNNLSSPPIIDCLPPCDRLRPKRIPNNPSSPPIIDCLPPCERLSPKHLPNFPSSPLRPDSLPPCKRLSPKHIPNNLSSPPIIDCLPPCDRLRPKRIPNNPSSRRIIDCLPPCDRLSPKHIPNNPSSPPIIDCLPPCERLSPKHLPNFPSSPPRPDSLPPCERLSPKHIPNNSSAPPIIDCLPPCDRLSPKQIPNRPSPPHCARSIPPQTTNSDFTSSFPSTPKKSRSIFYTISPLSSDADSPALQENCSAVKPDSCEVKPTCLSMANNTDTNKSKTERLCAATTEELACKSSCPSCKVPKKTKPKKKKKTVCCSPPCSLCSSCHPRIQRTSTKSSIMSNKLRVSKTEVKPTQVPTPKTSIGIFAKALDVIKNDKSKNSPCWPVMKSSISYYSNPTPLVKDSESQCPSKVIVAKSPKDGYAKKITGIFLRKKPSERKKNIKESSVWECETGIEKLNSRQNKTIELQPSTEAIRLGTKVKVQNKGERRDYSCGKNRSSIIGNIYDSKLNRLSTPVMVSNLTSDTKEDVSITKSEQSLHNLVEIQVKLRILHGDKTTEINIGKREGQEEKKEVIENSPQVYSVKNAELEEINEANPKNDVNIKIIVKNYKSKPDKPKYEVDNQAVDDYYDKISHKFNSVSTGYSDFNTQLTEENENVFSVHTTTMNLTSSSEKCETYSAASNESSKMHSDVSNEMFKIHSFESNDIDGSEEPIEKVANNTKSKTSCSKNEATHHLKTNSQAYDTHYEFLRESFSNNFHKAHLENIRKEPEILVAVKSEKKGELNKKDSSKIAKKELLKRVFQRAHSKPKNKSQVKQLSEMLKIITDSSTNDELSITGYEQGIDLALTSLKPNDFKDTDFMKNYYKLESTISSLKVERCSIKSLINENNSDVTEDDSGKASPYTGCMCSRLAEKIKDPSLNLGCRCRQKNKQDDEVNCDLYEEINAVTAIDDETQKSTEHSKININKSTNIPRVVITETKQVSTNRIEILLRPYTNKEGSQISKLTISDTTTLNYEPNNEKLNKDSDNTTSESKPTEKGNIFESYKAADILQCYETKKAVLEIYAEKTYSKHGEHLVAKLPKFLCDKESEIERNYDKIATNSYMSVCTKNLYI